MKVTLHDEYVLVESEDIDFTALRQAVAEASDTANNTIEVTDYQEE